MIDPTDVISVKVERWPKGRRGAAEVEATMKIRPKVAGTFEVEISFGGVPSRRRSLHYLVASLAAQKDLWKLIHEALSPIGDNPSNARVAPIVDAIVINKETPR